MHSIERDRVEQVATKRAEVRAIEERAGSDRHHLPTFPKRRHGQGEERRVQIRRIDPGGTHGRPMRTRYRKLPVRRILDHEIELAVEVERSIQADRVENEVRFDCLGVDSATTRLLTCRKRCPEAWQDERVALDRDDLNRQLRSFREGTADERRSKHARACARVEHTQRPALGQAGN